jgi:hypothetical protein
MLRMISEVPPSIVFARERKNLPDRVAIAAEDRVIG